MSRLFKPFLLVYAGLHIGGGAALWFVPSVTDPLFTQPLTRGVTPLLGFISILAGLGFLAAGSVTELRGRRHVVRLCLAGNVLNLVPHLWNVFRGQSPWWLAPAAIVSLGSFIAVLVLIHRDLARQCS